MSDYLLKILYEVKMGYRKDFSDAYLMLEDYLSKDENGTTFLEKIIQLGMKLDKKEEEKLYSSVEAAYIYTKYKKSILSFNLSEEDLFSKFKDQRYIDYFAKKRDLTNKIVAAVQNNIEIIDILIKTRNIYLIHSLSDNIIKKLLIPNEMGIYPIEKYINNKEVIPELIKLICDPQMLITILSKNNKLDLLKYANDIVLLYKPNDNETVFEKLYNRNIIPTILDETPDNRMFINFLRQQKLFEYLKSSKESVLLLKIGGEKTLLEELIENGYIPEMKYGQNDIETIQILYKLNRLDLAKNVSEYILIKSVNEVLGLENDKTLLEYMLDLGYNPLIECNHLYNNEIVKILYKRGFYELLGQVCTQEKLLIEVENGVTLLDKLLEKNIPQKMEIGFDSIEIAEKLFSFKKFDLLSRGRMNVLIQMADSSKTYLEYILEEINERGLKVDLKRISSWQCTAYEVARFYLTLAKYDMMAYVDSLSEYDLTKEYEGEMLLKELLYLDSNLTLNKIITKDVKRNPKVALLLKYLGFEQKNINIPLEKEEIPKEYIDNINKNLMQGPLYEEGELLLKKLEQLFLEDEKSDPGLIEALINSYRETLFQDYYLNIRELRKLVELKEKNRDKFLYKLTEDDIAHFGRGSVYSKYPFFGTLYHETGHALHSYLTDFEVPKEYKEVVARVRENPDTLKKVEEYAKEYRKMRKEIKEIAKEKCDQFFKEYYTEERINNIKEFLEKTKQEQIEEYCSLRLPQDVLEMLINELFTVEEYIEHQKREYIHKCEDFILRTEYETFTCIGDILDAIYEGKLRSNLLRNHKGEKINKTAGHGVKYYNMPKHGFDEMIANFSTIVKSKDSVEMKLLLNYLIGDELYNLLNKYYYTNIAPLSYGNLDNKKSL